ncbi:MAG: hypothetical protein ABIP55_04450 [Tepidisphaeraceae bacterium]
MPRPFQWLIILLVLASTSAALAQVKVVREPANVKTRRFDPQTPPRDMPALKPGEAAACESKFACAVQVEAEITDAGDGKPTAKVVAVNAQLKLAVIIWLPIDTTPKIRVHEDGHRAISETFYARGEKVAQALAKMFVGKPLEISDPDAKDTRPAIERIANEFCQEYLGAIEVPSQKAQEAYDRITDHGRNNVGEKKAIEEALREGEDDKVTR